MPNTYFPMVLRWIRLVHIFQMYIAHLTCTHYSEKKTEYIHKERTVANKIKKKIKQFTIQYHIKLQLIAVQKIKINPFS